MLGAPIPDAEFYGVYWRRQPVLVPKAELPPITIPSDYERLRSETLRVVETTAKGPKEHAADRIGNLNVAVANGLTVVSRNYERFSPWLRDAIAEWKATTKATRVWSNLYITPAGAQGFPDHTDKNEGFLFQYAGSKQWKLHFERQHAEAELGVGGFLYIPSGWFHSAVAGEKSVHLTIAFDWSPQ